MAEGQSRAITAPAALAASLAADYIQAGTYTVSSGTLNSSIPYW